MLNLLEPLLGRLRDMAADPDATDADIIKLFREIANRVGLSERHVIVPAAESAFDRLVGEGSDLIIGRGTSLREQLEGMAKPAELPTHNTDNGQPFDGVGEDDLEAFLEHRERRRQREAQTHISHGDHDVVTGEVIQRPAEDPFRMEEREREEYERSRSEYGPPAPKDDPQCGYEDRLRERVEESERR